MALVTAVKSYQIGFYLNGQLIIRGRPPYSVDGTAPTSSGLGKAPYGVGPLGR